MSVIVVSSYKGGTAKSTVSVNLAEAIRRTGRDVVLVDIDDSTQTASNWYRAYQSEDGSPPPLPKVLYMTGNVTDEIRRLSKVYEVVVVDCGAGNTLANQTAVRAADLLLIPVSASGLEILPTLRYAAEIAAVQAQNGGRPSARLVLNKIQAAKSGAKELIETTTSPACPVKPLSTLIPERSAFTRLNVVGVSVFDYPRCQDLREIFERMAEEVLAVVGSSTPTFAAKVG